MKTAIVVGATGATGRYITDYLLKSEHYQRVIAFSRRDLGLTHKKLAVNLVDFDQIDQWSEQIQGDDLFSALGTTLKLAGSKEAQYKVDHDYQIAIASAARNNGVKRLFLVSSPGANPKSKGFYLRMKGELDQAILGLGFSVCVLIKPFLINGERPDKRNGEAIGITITSVLSKLPGLKNFQPLTGKQIGKSIVRYAEQDIPAGNHEMTMDKILAQL